MLRWLIINRMIKIWLKRKLYKYSDYKIKKEHSIKLYWWNNKNNFGDLLNIELFHYLNNNNFEWVPHNYNKEYYMCIGSILHKAQENTIVWGSGFMTENSYPIKKPKNILAVRGPKTRDRFIKLGINCPNIFGDPALLMPLFYQPIMSKKYNLGIIPHFVDSNNEILDKISSKDIAIINVNVNNPKSVINKILQCKKIISSALHGIIISDAYKIPNKRVQFSNKITGGNFK